MLSMGKNRAYKIQSKIARFRIINTAHFLSYMKIQKKFIKAFKKGGSIKTSSLLFGEREEKD